MPRLPHPLLSTVLAALVAGCKVGTPVTPHVTPPRPSTTPVAVAVTPGPTSVGPGLIGDGGGSIIANHGAGLAGTVKAPAGLVTDNGSGLVTDNGSGIIANHGGGLVANNSGSYHLAAAPAQVPVKGAHVRLLDAAGQPVAGKDGKPLEVVTDAQGAYRFDADLPARNLVVAVDLAGGKGTLEAIAPPAPKDRKADLDLVSTLTSAYILTSYVRPQQDPDTVLDKLPADVEAATRVKAAAALDAAQAAPPDDLTPATVVAAVDGLRKASPAFDAQLEEVKKLLVAVGQSDLGAGRPAQEVRLRAIRNVLAAPDGSAYFTCPSDHRVWHLRKDGKLETAAGTGTARADGAVDGVAGVAAAIDQPYGLALDGQGRLLILERNSGGNRLLRLGADGKLALLWQGAGLLAVAPITGDDVKVVLADGLRWIQPVQGADPKPLGALDATKFAAAAGATSFGVDAQGRVTLGVPGDPARAIMLDATGLDGTIVAEGDKGLEHLAVEPGGRVIATVRTPDGLTLLDQGADGARTTLVQDLGTGVFFDSLEGAALTLDGQALLVQRGNLLWKTNGGGIVRVAGQQDPPNGNARDVAIETPNGMAVGPGGELYMCDKTTNMILRIGADQKVTVVSGTGVQGMAGDGGPADKAQQNLPRAIRIDGAGNLYVLQGGVGETVRKIAGGTITTAYKSTTGLYIRDLSVTADGKAYLALKAHGDGPTSVVRMDPDGTTTQVLAPSNQEGQILAVAPDGALWMLVGDQGTRTLVRWTQADGLKTIKQDARFAANYPNDSNGLCIDAKGRAIITLWALHQVWVYDPATDTATQVAGVGGTHFVGDGVDDGIEAPRYPTIGPQGELLFSDTHHHQVKRILAGEF